MVKIKVFISILIMLVFISCGGLLVGCNETPESEMPDTETPSIEQPSVEEPIENPRPYGRYEAFGYRTIFENDVGAIERVLDELELDQYEEGKYVILNEDGSAVMATEGAQMGDNGYATVEFEIVNDQLFVKVDGAFEYINYGYFENDNLYILMVTWGPGENIYNYDGNTYVYVAYEYIEELV